MQEQEPPKAMAPPNLQSTCSVKGSTERKAENEKKKVPVALSGEGVKKANRNQQPTKDKHSTKKLQGKFKHWGPHSRKLVTWVTS